MKRLWLAFTAVIAMSFAILGWTGVRIYQEAPPVPERVETTDGRTVIETGAIAAGQDVWRSMGGMEVGSIWGHGSYVAPDWTADYLHREATFVLNRWSTADFATYIEAEIAKWGRVVKEGNIKGQEEPGMDVKTYPVTHTDAEWRKLAERRRAA